MTIKHPREIGERNYRDYYIGRTSTKLANALLDRSERKPVPQRHSRRYFIKQAIKAETPADKRQRLYEERMAHFTEKVAKHSVCP